MPPVTSLIQQFEQTSNLNPIPTTQRVNIKRYSMPLRQGTLHFGPSPVVSKRQSTGAMATPPAEDLQDTIANLKSTAMASRVPLPTPSESATDVSSQTSSTPALKSPPKSRTKRTRDSIAAPKYDDKRTISGETLVDATASQTSLVKESIAALDMSWSIEDAADSDTIEIAVEADPVDQKAKAAEEAEAEIKREAKRVKIAENNDKWEARRKQAEKNSTRRSGRPSLLNKAADIVSNVLGKRPRAKESAVPERDHSISEEPESKKSRKDEGTIAAAARAIRARAPRDKKWLDRGLYAGQKRPVDEKKLKSDLPARRENAILPLPMFAGERLLDSGRDFKLPFDIYSPLPAGQPKPDEWKKVNRNVFIGDAAAEWRESRFSEYSTCMCKPETGCDDNCMNRYMFYECDEKNCNLKPEECGNRAFEGLRQRVKTGSRYNNGVEVMRTTDRGCGVRSSRTFEPNQIIMEYTGEIVTQEECETRMRTKYKDNECYYLMAFDQNMIIDATRGSITRFVNHSCDPNCRMEKWTVGGKPRMALFAGDRGIMTGEELTYDYNFDPYSQKNIQVCRCGSDNCRGVLGPRPKDLPKEKESKLAGAKRKIAEVLEESTNLLNKKRKVEDDKGRKSLPKGWAYIEPEPKATKVRTSEEKHSDDGEVKEQPSKLKRMLSQRSTGSGKTQIKRKSVGRTISTSSAAKLLQEDSAATGSSTVANLKAKAGSLKRNVSRSLRGRAT